MRLPALAVLALVCLWFGGSFGSSLWAAEVPLKDQPHLRRPIAAAWLVDGKLLAIANQRSGSISIVDLERRRVAREVQVGERLAHVAALPSAGSLLAVDENLHELIVLQWKAGDLQIAQRIPVSRYPVNIAVSPDGSRSTVASLWSRTITTFAIEPAKGPAPPTLTKLNELVLSFAPGSQIYLPDGEHVLVADAFTGQMALLDVTAQTVAPISANGVVRIYGMALGSDRGGIYVGHQALGPLPESYQARGLVGHNGNARRLISFVGQYSIAGLLNGRLEPFAGNRDAPTSSAPTNSGYFDGDLREMAELAPGLLTVKTKDRHQLLKPATDQPLVYVRRFWDALIVPDPDRPARRTIIRLGPVGGLTPADRGEALFYDTSLSGTGWMSCDSCHPGGHTTGQLVDTQADGSRGTHKRVLTLLGSGATGKWAWSGDVPALQMQVHKSLQTTMRARSTPQKVNDITAFLQTLPPPPPLKPATDDPADQAQLRRGEELFHRRGCATCHVPAHGYTSDATYDVGLRDEQGMTRFNPPSLRGVSQGYSFFHDGRATRLEDVFITHGHPHGDTPPADQLADLLRFLSSL